MYHSYVLGGTDVVTRPMGQVSGLLTRLNQPAGEIVKEISAEALELLQGARSLVGGSLSKL